MACLHATSTPSVPVIAPRYMLHTSSMRPKRPGQQATSVGSISINIRGSWPVTRGHRAAWSGQWHPRVASSLEISFAPRGGCLESWVIHRAGWSQVVQMVHIAVVRPCPCPSNTQYPVSSVQPPPPAGSNHHCGCLSPHLFPPAGHGTHARLRSRPWAAQIQPAPGFDDIVRTASLQAPSLRPSPSTCQHGKNAARPVTVISAPSSAPRRSHTVLTTLSPVRAINHGNGYISPVAPLPPPLPVPPRQAGPCLVWNAARHLDSSTCRCIPDSKWRISHNWHSLMLRRGGNTQRQGPTMQQPTFEFPPSFARLYPPSRMPWSWANSGGGAKSPPPSPPPTTPPPVPSCPWSPNARWRGSYDAV
ncbi:hypothetical protein QBC39DRAFT_40553 [Podospora conica]|nr:hypothetical protein QBC39DRAFT_40553 [Schizothecium conicum]